jgi:hypothetical protein
MIVEGELLVSPGDRGNRRLKRSAMVLAWSIEKRAMSKFAGFIIGAIEIGIGIATGNVALIIQGGLTIAPRRSST